jgi:hypothetical protein
MENYLIVLFKNKKKRRIIKKFITLEKAKQAYQKLMNISRDIIFDVKVENGLAVEYELAIIDLKDNSKFPIYKKDDYGRNLKVKVEDPGFSILEMNNYKKEEKIFDIQKNKKIDVKYFIKNYLKKDELKIISTLNNKIVVQKDDETFLFSLKNEEETLRFIDVIANKFRNDNRGDCMFITDISTPQRKYMLKILEEKGFDKKMLYKNVTTYPRSKA